MLILVFLFLFSPGPFLLFLLASQGASYSELTFAAAVGPLPHTVLAHLFAYWLTEKVVNDHNERFGVVQYEVSQAGVRTSRFGITHIMILTIWVALGFSLLSFTTPEFRLLLARLLVPFQVAAALLAMIVISLFSYIRRYRKRNVSASEH